jgi:hypothetical protein
MVQGCKVGPNSPVSNKCEVKYLDAKRTGLDRSATMRMWFKGWYYQEDEKGLMLVGVPVIAHNEE